MKNKKTLTTLLLGLIAIAVFADSGIYICGHFRRDRTKTVPALKASGYTFGILFNVHVEVNGDLTTDGETICKDGIYVFGNTSPNYIDDVNALLTGNTSIKRLEHCIGGWGNKAYTNITKLVKSQGTGESSILYKNFKALKDAIPAVIAINNDIEEGYDADSQAQFHIMLYDIGFKTTIAPYMNKSYWESFVKKVNTARPGAVDRNYLQCYGGGAGNNPKDWKIEGLPVYGSRDIESNSYTHQQIVETMTNWKNNTGIVGGFYWNYNWDRNLKAEAAPINEVFGGGEITYHDQIVAMFYPVEDYKAPQTDFSLGIYKQEQIIAKGFDPEKLSGIKLKDGIKVILYTGDNNTGQSYVITQDTPDISIITENNEIKSWTIQADQIEELDGKEFAIKNKVSGYFLRPMQDRATNGLSIQQKEWDNSDYIIWKFESVKDGLYKIVNKGSNKILQLRGAGIYNDTQLEQSSYRENENQHFIVKYDESSASYKFILLHSLKYVGLRDNELNTVNSQVVQRQYTSGTGTDWLLETLQTGLNELYRNDFFDIYPNVVQSEIYIKNKTSEQYSLKLVDQSGRVVINQHTPNDRLDVSNLNKGYYFLIIEGVNQSTLFKIIKV